MEMIADILLVAGALGAGFYCFVLARRLNRFNDLEKGVGGAVAVLSSQVDDLNKSLVAARAMSDGSTKSLEGLTNRAESVAQRLELMMASMHDLPAAPTKSPRINEESDALAEALTANPKSDTKPLDEPEKPASGLMFVRHNRNQSRVA
ncbi:hypothetical protein EBB79_20955 [Parasedimentitalea marina]|uniref:Uncharacterized protein n=1 Tax=Parasedimentitalea marina TaxID=2483033 RepID=A0A3T0N7W1_9RHOB|nr:hypothetical protein [Parasedimentitalea marina]AZV80116.1 hypothetical protein EBB79_20955 [Parasedimentitalea marina]